MVVYSIYKSMLFILLPFIHSQTLTGVADLIDGMYPMNKSYLIGINIVQIYKTIGFPWHSPGSNLTTNTPNRIHELKHIFEIILTSPLNNDD